jgi:hypothetical protein
MPPRLERIIDPATPLSGAASNSTRGAAGRGSNVMITNENGLARTPPAPTLAEEDLNNRTTTIPQKKSSQTVLVVKKEDDIDAAADESEDFKEDFDDTIDNEFKQLKLERECNEYVRYLKEKLEPVKPTCQCTG